MTGYQSKKAAAQAKVEGPVHVVCQCDKCKAQPKQEPVAWSYWQSCLNDDDTQTAPWVHRLSKFKPTESIINKDVIPLYTTPPQRTWVGLTEEDFSAINQSCLTKLEAAASAESILKEKNT